MTGKQMRIASKIDAAMQALARTGKNDMAVFADMAEHMADFKWLIDNARPGVMNELCQQYAGFFQYAKILETVAAGIQARATTMPE